jgi:hypothetical protein
MAAGTAPWWAVPVTGGAFALLGVFAAQIITVGLERRRAAREQAQRIDHALRSGSRDLLALLRAYRGFIEEYVDGCEALDCPELMLSHLDERLVPFHKRALEFEYDLELIAPPELLDVIVEATDVIIDGWGWGHGEYKDQRPVLVDHVSDSRRVERRLRDKVRTHFGLAPLDED